MRTPVSATLTRSIGVIGLARHCNAVCNALAVGPQTTLVEISGARWLANAADTTDFLGLANELTIEPDGWALIPYGDSEHSGADGRNLANASGEKPKPILQRFDRAAAEAIVADFKSTWSRIKRAVVGQPIYKGHPDAPRFAKRFPDKTPQGTIADMEVRDRGLALRPVLTAEGAQLVERDGWSAFSPYWPSRPIGEENGKRVFSPYRLISIGLLPPGRENIAGLSLANAAEPPLSTAMNEKLKKFLISIGLSVAEDADETALANAIDLASTAHETLKTEKASLASQVSTLTTDLAAANQAKDSAVALANAKEGELSAATTKLTAERTARAKLVVLGAVKAGRVAINAVDTETLALANAADFDAAATALAARRVTLPAQSRLGTLPIAGRGEQDRTTTVLHLVNAKMEEAPFKALPEGERYDKAFIAVKDDPAHAALFATASA